MSSADFAKMPGWNQADAKKKHLLFLSAATASPERCAQGSAAYFSVLGSEFLCSCKRLYSSIAVLALRSCEQ
jgi:hypothetical protein